MSKQTNEERLATVETKLDFIIEQQKSVMNRLDTLLPTFASAETVEKVRLEIGQQIKDLNSKKWIQNTLAAILGSILTLLITYFIQNVGR